jgi:hypothetical protein
MVMRTYRDAWQSSLTAQGRTDAAPDHIFGISNPRRIDVAPANDSK